MLWNREQRRDYTTKQSQEAAKKLEDMPVENMAFLQGEELPVGMEMGGPGIPQPPEYPQPARPQGLPRWQTEPKNMIDDTMTKWTGPIDTEQDYEAVQDRLRYLLAYQPTLSGEMRIRCDTAIRLLKDRVKEYEQKNINQFIRTIDKFVSRRIDTPAQLVEAENYLADLTERRLKLAGEYARAANEYISRLTERIRNYREMPVEGGTKMNESKKELTKEISQITGHVKGLGSPAGKRDPTPIENIDEAIRPFSTFVLRGAENTPTWRHRIQSEYCHIQTIVAGKEWRLGFEDRDEAFGPSPDWDYDEPLLHIVRTNDDLTVTIEKYGGWAFSAIYYGDTLLWDKVGGMLHYNVGQTATTPILPGAEPPPPPPPPPPPLSLEWLKKYAPWLIGVALIGGTIAVVVKKKK